MTTKDAIKHLSHKIAFAKQCDEKWAGGIHIDALEIAVRAMAEERKKGEWEEKTVLYDDLSIEQWQSARCSACGCITRLHIVIIFIITNTALIAGRK